MISLTVVVDENMGIGFENGLLAHIPEDLHHFKSITDGKVVVMGYNTYMSLPPQSRPLPNRTNVVLTRKNIQIEGAVVKSSIDQIMSLIEDDYSEQEVIIMGGESIYSQFLPFADRLYVTHVFRKFKADTFFPVIPSEWKIVDLKGDRVNISNEFPHVFAIYEKEGADNV